MEGVELGVEVGGGAGADLARGEGGCPSIGPAAGLSHTALHPA
jgi:hypothetical protein